MDTVIIDSGGANLASLQFALERLDARAVVSNDPNTIANAPRVILPGVGSAVDAMTRLRAAGLDKVLPALKQPVLGICLGIIPDTVRRLKAEPGRPVPHMGWNQLTAVRADPLLANVAENEYVYFVHGYAAPVSDVTLAATDYGSQVSAVVRRGNFWGTQFHPERSGPTGAKFLANFLRLN
jgi:glutamine amidotransferase